MTAPEHWSTWRKSSFSAAGNGNCIEVAWRKSSHSGATNGNCVEVAWNKSSFSAAGNGDCVEVAFVVEAVAVRDSKNPDGPRLEFPQSQWRRFVK